MPVSTDDADFSDAADYQSGEKSDFIEEEIRHSAEHVISLLPEDSQTVGDQSADALEGGLLSAVGAIALSDRERLILKMLFWDGLKPTAAAKALQMEKKEFDRLKDQIFEKARTQLAAIGIESPFSD